MTRPALGRSRPAARWSSVDLPEPDGPMTETNSPGSMVSETLVSARTSVGPAP